MDVQVKRATPRDVERLGILSDQVFRPALSPGTGMPVEFAPMFAATNAANLYHVDDGEQAVCLVGMMPGVVHVAGMRISVASMGSVCTLPAYRKLHLASAAIAQVLQDFSPHTSVLFVSGDLSIYRRIGCVEFGHYCSLRLQRGAVDLSSWHIECVSPPAVLPEATLLYQAQGRRFSRTPSQMAALFATLEAPSFHATPTPPQMFVARLQGEVVAYAIALRSGAGRDASVHLVEWAGARSAIAHLAEAAMQHEDCAQAQLYAAPDDWSLKTEMRGFGAEEVSCTNQGTVRVLNPDLLLQESALWIAERFGARLTLTSVGEEEWQIGWADLDGSAGARAGSATFASLLHESAGKRLAGYEELSRWLFSANGLDMPLPRTDDLNYI